MAKQGFSYYKAETDRFQDIKIKRLKKKYHCTGYAVYQYVLNEIYRVRGYCLQFTEDHLFDVSEYWDIDEQLVTDIIGYCAEIGLFSAQLWTEKGILTARSIQTRYIDICKVCKKTPAIEEELRLVSAEQTAPAPEPLPSLFEGDEMPPMRIVPPTPVAASPLPSASKGLGKAVLEQLAAEEAQPVSEDFRKLPELSGKTPEECDKSIKSYASKSTSSNSPTAEEADKASRSKDWERLRLLLQSTGCIDDDWRWICSVEHIEAAASPVWQLIDEVRQSRGRLTVRSYLIPALRALVKAGSLRIRPQTRDTAAELRQQLRQIKVSTADIERVLAAADGQEQALREAIDEVRRSKGKITMPARFLLSQLRKAIPAKAS